MTTIRSDKEAVQTYASQLVTACQILSDVGNVSQDTQTELQGNTKAHDLMEESKSLLAQIVSSVEKLLKIFIRQLVILKRWIKRVQKVLGVKLEWLVKID